MSEKGRVLVTGASTGIGLACAKYLAARGFDVLAGVRNDADARVVEQSPGVRALHLDVTDRESISRAAADIGDLRALINNAGITVLGPIEFVPLEGWRKQFEVNLFGQMAVTQAMLPALRRDGRGRIIFIGSIAGRVGQPILGPYCASKHALASVADSLRVELHAQGIHVSLIEPGAIQSEIWNKGLTQASEYPEEHPARKLYGRFIAAIQASAELAQQKAIPAESVARVVHECIMRDVPRTRILVGTDARLGAMAKRLLPDRWFDALLMKGMKLK